MQTPECPHVLLRVPRQGTKGWVLSKDPLFVAAGLSVLGVLCNWWLRAGLLGHSDTGIFLFN